MNKNITSICLENVNLVEAIAKQQFKKYQSGGLLDLSDLIGMGFLGLIDAATRFDLNKKVDFRTFASHRVRGEIIDKTKEFLQPGKGITTVNMEESELELLAFQDEKAQSELLKKELLKIIERIIVKNLNHQERKVINLKYKDGFNTTKISKIMKVTPGRISQIEKSAIKKIRRKLMEY